MNAAQLLAHFDRIVDTPDAIPHLRQFILELAVRGRLVEQDPNDEPASDLLKRINAEKMRLAKAGKLRPEKPPTPASADDLAFELKPKWQAARISQILVELQTGPFGSSLHQSDYQKGGTPVINPASIRNGRLVPIESMAVGPASLERLATFKLHAGDIVMARRGEMGRCAVVSEREAGWLCGTGSLILHMPECIFPRFLVTLIGSPFVREYLGGSAVGATMQNLNQSILLSLIIGLPPLAEQRRIVAKVDELMALCDRLEAAQAERESRRDRMAAASLHCLNQPADTDAPEVFREHARFYLNHLPRLTIRPEQIKQLRQAILNLAVRGQLVPQDPNDEPAARLLGNRQIKLESETAPFKLPSGWAWSSLALTGETLGGGTPSKADPEFWIGPIPWVSPKDMKVDEITDAQDHVSALAVEHSAARLIPTGSLLMVVRGMILAHSFPTAITALTVTINQDMKAIVPFRPDMIRFLLLLTKGLKPEVLRLVLRSTHGTCKLLTDDLFSLPIPFAPLAEQHRIVAKVDELMALCDQLEAQLTTAQAARRCLLEAVLHEALASAAPENP